MFVLKAGALLSRVERCLLGLVRLVDSGLARLNNTDQRIVIRNNNMGGQLRPAGGRAGPLADEPAEGKHSQFSVSSLRRTAFLDEDNLPC